MVFALCLYLYVWFEWFAVCDFSIISGFAAEGVFALSSRDWCVAMLMHLCCCWLCLFGDVFLDG